MHQDPRANTLDSRSGRGSLELTSLPLPLPPTTYPDPGCWWQGAGSWRGGGRGAGRRGAGASAAEPARAALAASTARRMRGPGRRPRRSVQLGTAPPPPRRIWAAGSRHRYPEPFKDPYIGRGPAPLVLARGSQPQPFTDLSAAATSALSSSALPSLQPRAFCR